MTKLIRGLNLTQAVAINTTDMVGIGPFVALPFIMGIMPGWSCLIPWMLGALLAFADGSVWAELGAKWPEAGGSYIFLQRLYSEKGKGRLMSFLYTWQTAIQAPLVIASGAIGFSQYFNFLYPLTPLEEKGLSGLLVILVTFLLYRKITDVGRISTAFGVVVILTIVSIIISGLIHYSGNLLFHFQPFSADNIGDTGKKAIYCYLGYYNVCHLGGEIRNPERNIPRSIFISVAIIALLYMLMQLAVMFVVPFDQAQNSKFIISLFFEKLYGHGVAQIATGLILLIALSSLFSVMLGYSRVPYAAATDKNFFPVFAKLHPTKNFPHISLLALGSLAFVFSLLFKLKQVIDAIIIMRILVQFVGQGAGLLAYHRNHPKVTFPFRMWLYPIPALLALVIWLFIFCEADIIYIGGAAAIVLTGLGLYWLKERNNSSITAEQNN